MLKGLTPTEFRNWMQVMVLPGRTEPGVTCKEVANALGVNVATVYGYASPKRNEGKGAPPMVRLALIGWITVLHNQQNKDVGDV